MLPTYSTGRIAFDSEELVYLLFGGCPGQLSPQHRWFFITYPLEMFVAAYRKQRDGEGVVLECKSPRQQLGRFAVEEEYVLPMAKDSAPLAAEYAGVPGDPHHVCLMRSPELVVRYLEQTEPSSASRAYAGVFRAADELDDTYAASEPPTRDQWVPNQLAGRDKTFVRVTFTRIKEELAHYRTAPVATVRNQSGTALGAASSFLGTIVAAAFARPDAVPAGRAAGGAGAGGGGSTGGPGGGGGGRPSPVPRDRVRVSELSVPMVDEHEGRAVLVQRFSVTGPGPVTLQARLSVGVGARAREDEAPVGAARPEVLGWLTADGPRNGDSCEVASPSEVELVIVPVADTITDIAVTGTRSEELAT